MFLYNNINIIIKMLNELSFDNIYIYIYSSFIEFTLSKQQFENYKLLEGVTSVLQLI